MSAGRDCKGLQENASVQNENEQIVNGVGEPTRIDDHDLAHDKTMVELDGNITVQEQLEIVEEQKENATTTMSR